MGRRRQSQISAARNMMCADSFASFAQRLMSPPTAQASPALWTLCSLPRQRRFTSILGPEPKLKWRNVHHKQADWNLAIDIIINHWSTYHLKHPEISSGIIRYHHTVNVLTISTESTLLFWDSAPRRTLGSAGCSVTLRMSCRHAMGEFQYKAGHANRCKK